jgi:two-component SAPR family response regulator
VGPALIALATVKGGSESVLLVEKRRVAQRQLEARGCVLKTDQAAAALESLASERVDLRFSNIVMPGGSSGFELARTAISHRSRVRVLLTSGFPEAKSNGPGCACCPKTLPP